MSTFTILPQIQPMYTPEDMEWLERFGGLNLNPPQKRMLLFARAHGGSFTNRDWQRVCEVDIYAASRDIKDMLRKGCMAHPEKGGRIYHIVYPDQGRKIEFPGEYSKNQRDVGWGGYVANQDIREILKVQRFTATRIAKRLIDLGLLAPTGKGRGAKYIKRGINK